MKMHPRCFIVQQAKCEVERAMLDAIQKHGLTHGEIAQILGDQLQKLAMYQIRAERHPDDPAKRGGEE